MKPTRLSVCSILAAALLSLVATTFAGVEVTVNSTNNSNTADSEFTLMEAILYFNEIQGTPGDPLGRPLSAAESNQVATVVGTTNRIKFNISGDGPHYIKTPNDIGSLALYPYITASNLVVDGYSQPGASPNTNPVLATNVAVLKIVIDTRATANPGNAEDFAVIAENVFFRGLSFLGGAGGVIFSSYYGTYPNKGGGVQGCWFGVDPDRTTVAGQEIGVSLYFTEGFQVLGTDGDGIKDREEFNVWVGAKEMAILLQAEGYGTTNCRISGNFIGVMPDGFTSVPADYVLAQVKEGDGIECEGVTNLVFGTDSDGVADEDERNVVGGLIHNAALPGSAACEVIECWGDPSHNIQVMGNYIGVAIDGATPLGNTRFFNASSRTTAQFGANGDGVRDDIEANLIANHAEYVFDFSNTNTVLAFGRNSFFNNTANFFNDPQNSYNAAVLGLPNPTMDQITPAISNSTTRTELIGWVPVSGDGGARTNAQIHIYEADPFTAATRPQGKQWLATYADNGPHDLDSRTNYFRFNICSLPIPSTGAALTLNETCGDGTRGGSSQFSTTNTLPDVSNTLTISQSGGSATLSWLMNGVLQARPSLNTGNWTNVPGCSPMLLPASSGSLYFRVAQ